MHLDNPTFDLPTTLPFPVGTSPFRQKGMVYRGNFEFLAAKVPGGTEAAFRALPDEKLRAFFRQPFDVSGWYDALPGVVQQAAAQLRGVTLTEQGRQTGEYHARSRMTGIYRALLQVLSTENVAIWAPRISSVYYSFGKLNSRVIGARNVALVRHGIPRMLVRWMTAIMTGMGTETLKIVGARDVKVNLGGVHPDGSLSGYSLHRIEGDICWNSSS